MDNRPWYLEEHFLLMAIITLFICVLVSIRIYLYLSQNKPKKISPLKTVVVVRIEDKVEWFFILPSHIHIYDVKTMEPFVKIYEGVLYDDDSVFLTDINRFVQPDNPPSTFEKVKIKQLK